MYSNRRIMCRDFPKPSAGCPSTGHEHAKLAPNLSSNAELPTIRFTLIKTSLKHIDLRSLTRPTVRSLADGDTRELMLGSKDNFVTISPAVSSTTTN